MRPLSRQESECEAQQSRVDPIQLANRLADIPSVGEQLLGSSLEEAAPESPPYGEGYSSRKESCPRERA